VDQALTQFDPDGKKVFYHLLEESYGVKPKDMAKNFDFFHDALKEYYGIRHFGIQTLIIRILQKNNRLGLYSKNAELTAFNLLVNTFGKETNEHIKRVKNFANLTQYTQELQERVKAYDDKLRQAERMVAIGETAAMVGHDIRNPLQAMISDVYLLRSDLADISDGKTKGDMKESLDSLEKNIAYINKIVADLQDYAKPLNPEYSTVNLVDVVAELFKTIDLPDTITLTTSIRVPLQIRTEPTFLRRMLTNLINNAIQAMPNGGKLHVDAFDNGCTLFISVSDSGGGIPEEVKAKLFKPMVTTKSKGQGFGLAVAKRLVDTLSGSITFESEEGNGTKFTIKLPLSLKPNL
jgi:Signal transduction histidine kinase